MKLGIFGGTFNPPHMGHVEAARRAVARLELDCLWLMPTSIPPHKPLPQGSATPAQRLAMAELSARLIPSAVACGLELDRQGPSYTVDTLTAVAAARPQDSLWLILGTDMLLSFERWVRYRDIAAMARLAVVSRESGDLAPLRDKAQWLERDCGARVTLIENPPLVMSSTEARSGGGHALPPAVAAYVARHRLYGEAAVLDALRQVAADRLSEYRYRHTLGVEAMAARLALRHGADVLAARYAALLHDITKELPLEAQLQMCRAGGIMVSYPEDTLEAVLHADTAALEAAEAFDMPPEVCDAIRYHSTGRPHMSKLEKILYVADKVEDGRRYADVPPIRRQAMEDLDGATVSVLRQALAALERQGKTPYGRTADALATMTGENKL